MSKEEFYYPYTSNSYEPNKKEFAALAVEKHGLTAPTKPATPTSSISEQQGLTQLEGWASSRASYDLSSRRNPQVFDELNVTDWKRINDATIKELKEFHPKSYSKMKDEGFSDSTPMAIDSLVDYLQGSAKSDRPLVMPSEMADVMWKGFIEREPKLYKEFCEKFVGKVIERNSETSFQEASKKPDFEDRLCETWVAMYRHSHVQPAIQNAPPLFTLDASSKMPGGRTFWEKDGTVQCATVNSNGFYSGAKSDLNGVNMERMSELNLITPSELKQGRKDKEEDQALKVKQASQGKFMSILSALTGPKEHPSERLLYRNFTARYQDYP